MLFFQPVKLNCGVGTGIGTFTPTIPASISEVNFRAAAPSFVKMQVPFPKGFSFANLIALSRSGAVEIVRTGPKI